MKKIILSVLIVAVAFTYSINAIAQVTLTNTVHTATVNFNGLNGQNTTHDGTYWRQLSLSPDAVNILKELHPSMVRYPAGTISNYWDWLKAWYVDSLTVLADDCPGIPDEFALNANVVSGQPNSIDNYLAHIRNTGATPVIVLNVLTSELNYQLNFLRAMAARGVPITYVELGNEFYLENCFYSTKYNAADDYVAECATYITAIKSEWSNAKVAIIGAEANDKDLTRRKNWVTDILNACNSHQVVPDAITIHMYSGTGVNGGCSSNTITTAKAEQALSAVPYALGLNQASGALGNTDGIIYQEIAAIKAQYQNCEIWFTEYDMADNNVPVHGKWVQGMYVAAMALHFLEDENIKHNTFHAMTGDALQAAFIGTDDAAFAFKTDNCTACPQLSTANSHYKFTAMGQCLSMVNKAFSIGGAATKLDFNNSNTITYKKSNNPNAIYYYYPALYGWQFRANNGTQQQAIILNLSGTAYTKTVAATVIPYTNAFYETTSANPDNYIINGLQYPTSICTAALALNTASGAFTGNITLPPFSITRLYFYEPATGISASAVKPNLCEGESTTLSATGEDNWTYAWSPTNDLSNSNDQNPLLTTTASTPQIYTVTATDAYANTYTATVSITVNQKTPITILTSTTTSCIAVPITLTADPVGLVSYNWAKVGQSLSNTNTTTVTPDKPDKYFVWALNSQGCYSEAYINLPTENVYFDLGKAQVLCTNESKTFTLPNSGTQNYQWIIDNKVVGSAETYTFTPTATGTCVLSATVNQNGCTYTHAVTITVVNCCSTPNIYTISSETKMADLLTIPGTIPIPEENRYNVVNANITISGVWDISSIVEFKNCDITMQPGAKINVLPYQRLYLKGTTINGCNEMWQGIYLHPHARLFCSPTANTVTTVADAVNGIFADDFSYFNINGTTFNNNFIGINTPLNTLHTTSVIRSILQSTLTSNGLFKSPYPGMPTTVGNYPYAGIQLNKTIMSIGSSASSFNLFDRLNAGVIAYQSDIVLMNNHFTNIHYISPSFIKNPFNGCAVYAAGNTNGSNTFSNVTMGLASNSGNGVFDNEITNSSRGIYATTSNAHLFNLKAENVIYGMQIANASYGQIEITNDTLHVTRQGIGLYLNDLAQDIAIQQNTIKLDFVYTGTIYGNGISSSCGIADDRYNNFSNPKTSIHHNTIDVTSSGYGMVFQNCGYSDINTNNIYLDNPSSYNFCITNKNCKDLIIKRNNLFGSNATSTSHHGSIWTAESPNNTFCCNSTGNTYVGFSFDGNCDQTLLEGNDIGSHFYGLMMSSGTFQKIHSNKGNAWNGAYGSTFGAIHFGISPDIDQFEVDPNLPNGMPAWLTPNNIGSNWFIYQPGTEYNCLNAMDCNSSRVVDDNITYIDRIIAQDTLPALEFEDAINYTADKNLYAKADGFADSLSNFYEVDSFYLANKYLPIGILNSISKALVTTDSNTTVLAKWLDHNDSLRQLLWKQYLLNQEYQITSQTLNSDSLDTLNQVLLNALQLLWQSSSDIIAQLNSSSTTNNQQLAQINTSVITANTIDDNEKTVNTIYFDLATNHFSSITTAGYNTLFSIANECPVTGGKAVYKARALLAYFNDTLEYDDKAVCLQQGIAYRLSQTNTLLSNKLTFISPNPAANEATLYCEASEPLTLVVYNAFMSKVMEVRLTQNIKSHALNFSNLKNGMYCYTIVAAHSIVSTGAFTVIK